MSNGRSSSASLKAVRFLVLAAMAVAVVAAVLLPLGGKGARSAARLVGRLHVLALHVPIGVMVTALVAEAATFVRRSRRVADAVVGFTLPLLVLSGAAAVVLGLMLAHGGPYAHDLAAPHRNLTIASILLAGAATLLWPRRQARRLVHRVLLGASALAMTVGAHFGGSMTHGADFLRFGAPTEVARDADTSDDATGSEDAGSAADAGDDVAPLAVNGDAGEAGVAASEDAGSAADAGRAPDASAPAATATAAKPAPPSRAQAQAIIQRRCSPCHTTKGSLRLSDLSKPLKEGVLVPGSPGASSLYTRLVLPLDDDDHMPPADEAQPTAGEIAILRAFIAAQKPAAP